MRDMDCEKKHFQHIVNSKVTRPDEDKELFAEMTSEEERTYKSAMALDSEQSLSFSLSLLLRWSVPINLLWLWKVSALILLTFLS